MIFIAELSGLHMKEISKYFIALVLFAAIVHQLLSLIKLFFHPFLLKHEAFNFQERKSVRVLYYLCTMLIALIVILLELRVIK